MNKLNKATEANRLLVDRAQRARQDEAYTTRTDTRKQVAFEPNAKYRVVEHHSSFSTREKSSVWYQDAEFAEIRKGIKRSTRAMAKGRQEGIEVVRSHSNPELVGSGTSRRTREYCYRGKSAL